MPKPFRFPLEFYKHPAVKDLNPSQAGLFRLLIEHYWITGTPLPESPNKLMRAINTDYATFKRYGKRVMEVVQIVLPAFIEERKRLVDNVNQRQITVAKNRKAIKHKDQSKQTKLSDKNDPDKNPIVISPVPPECYHTYHPGFHDKQARIEAMKKPKDSGVRFKDK